MKKICVLALLIASTGAMAQIGGTANNSSSATTSAQGNSQAVIFNTSNPGQISTTSTNTQNIISSGTTKNITAFEGSYTIKNVPSVNGPNLTTSNDTCMGSSSASANGPGIGLSFGTTWTDEHCKRLKMSRELWNKGMKAASLAMDCMDPAAMAALEMTGTKCPQSMTASERVAAYGPQASSAGAPPSVAAPAVSQSAAAAPPVAAAPPAAPVPAAAPVAAAPPPAAAVPPAGEALSAVSIPVALSAVFAIDAADGAAAATQAVARPQ